MRALFTLLGLVGLLFPVIWGARADTIGFPSPVPLSQGGTGDTGTAWTTYTPTVSASSGTITTASATGKYKKIGLLITVNVVATITTNGTGAALVLVTLPFAATSAQIGSGRETAVGKGLVAQSLGGGSTTLYIINYDGTYPAANGSVLNVNITYESTT